MSVISKSQSHTSPNHPAPNHASQNQPTAKKRILVVDDHPIVRQGLALLINREPDLLVCGEAEEAMGATARAGLGPARCAHRGHLAEWP